MSNTIVTWGELPPTAGLGRKLSDKRRAQMEALKGRPGAWAIVENFPTQGDASSARQTFKRHGFDATTRATGEGSWNLWASWPINTKES